MQIYGVKLESHGILLKEYRTTCLLGCETDTYDSEGARVRVAPWRHVTREQVEISLGKFRGDIAQAPPMCVGVMFSSLLSHHISDSLH
jgi:tRNA U55 pseudouridine synthase TruB